MVKILDLSFQFSLLYLLLLFLHFIIVEVVLRIVHFRNQVKEDTDLFIIDEVGKMELFSSSFFPAVLRVLESNIPVLASIPIPKFGRDIPGGTFVQHVSDYHIFIIT